MAEPKSQVRPFLESAASARQRGDIAGEIATLGRALEAHPDDPHVLNARGTRALADGDSATALRCFVAATERDPSESVLWLNLASAYRAIGDDDGERVGLDRALECNQLNFMAQFRLAELNQRCGLTIEAVQRWGNVLQMAAGLDGLPPALIEAIGRGRAFVDAHNARISAALDAELGPALAASPGGARRFTACVDHALGRRRVFQNECAGVYFPFLPADEFFDRAHFPWFAQLEARTAAIRSEALTLLANGGADIRPYVRQEKGTPENKWTVLDQSLDWSACFLWEYGERNDAVCERCPETAAALASLPRSHIPGKAPSAFFSILKPHAHIPPHTGVTNTRAIIHLPLVVPPGCRFRVGGETREWREGEAFAFDDTIEHEAWNDGTDDRIILIFDAWRPELDDRERAAITAMFEAVDNY